MNETYIRIGSEIGELVARKNASYGNSIEKAAEILKILYPSGLRPDQYLDFILASRDADKRSRIAQGRVDDEDPWLDIAGHALLGVAMRRSNPRYTAQELEVDSSSIQKLILPLVRSAMEVATIKCGLLDLICRSANKRNERGDCAQCGEACETLQSHEFPFMGSEARGPYLFCGSFCIEAFKSILVELFASPFEDLHAKLQGKETAPCHSVSANDAEPSSTTKADSASHPDDASPKTTTIENGKSGKPSGGALHSASPSSFASTAVPAATVMVAVSQSPEQRERERADLLIRGANRNSHKCCAWCGLKLPSSALFLSPSHLGLDVILTFDQSDCRDHFTFDYLK